MRSIIIFSAIVALAAMMGAVWSSNRHPEVNSQGDAPSPWTGVPPKKSPFSHAKLISGPFKTGEEVTQTCLACHPNAAKEMMQTEHWTWRGNDYKDPDTGEVIKIGKYNLLNNFCIHAMPNIGECSSCHAGYGWEDEHYTFDDPTKVDCLVCHDLSNTYVKSEGGHPAEGVDLVAVAKSVGRPGRKNCGVCHFSGAGGDGVKHGDLDGTLYYPTTRLDVHMGRHDFQCVDCHKTKEHKIPGMSMSISVGRSLRVTCTECHGERPHQHERLDAHTKTVACQTCHIPRMAIDIPTQMEWDWSVSGKDHWLVDGVDVGVKDRFVYMKTKGSFKYAQFIRPQYFWWNGRSDRYLTGAKIDPAQPPVQINHPHGDVQDPEAKIWPFKVHVENQPYDKKNLVLLTPRTWAPKGEKSYWNDFNWDEALAIGSDITKVPYSHEFDFVKTEMYWPQSHMVQAKEKALQCVECHGPTGIMQWQRLGFDGDPAFRGNRRRMELLRDPRGGGR